FPLEWLHLENMRRPELSHGDEITLAIAYLRNPRPDGLREVLFAGDFRFRPKVEYNLPFRFRLRVTVFGTNQFIERQFALFPDTTAALGFSWTYEGPFSAWDKFVRLMRRSWALAVVAALFLLLSFPTSASADCASVLWEDTIWPKGKPTTEPIRTYN